MDFSHVSVLLKETVGNLITDPNGIYVDGTLGGAGHSYEICSRLSEQGRLIGIDQDADAIAAATKRLEPFKDKVTIIRSNYCEMPARLREIGIQNVDGIMLDLGVSSYQLDEPARGFTYKDEHAPLDIAYQAKVQKMERHFYPNRYFDVSYSAQWDALSIWEHEEPYTIYQSKTVYIDY